MPSKRYHHGDLRNSLIEAGMKLIHEEGEKSLTLRKVASLCGVSQAAPYSHFQSKEELLEAMRVYVTDQFMAALNTTLLEFENKLDPNLLIQIGKCYVAYFIRHPLYFSFLFSDQGVQVNLAMEADDCYENFPPYQLMKTLSVPILSELGMPQDNMEDAIIHLWATVHGLAAIATMKNVRYSKNWEDKIEDIITNRL